ncbi:MAG TPA: hypothetical protein VLG11_02785 [Candidatus Saccharimonadales bacterium]|nr:hypothetical protein [Candidatus Saccharimonadales bacterium]
MSEHISGGEQQPPTPEQAMEATAAHLDEHGKINYDSFSPEVLQALRDGPGAVTQVVEQDTDADQLPDLIVGGALAATSAERFFDHNSNMVLFFENGFGGDIYRSMQVYQRLAILFPELVQAGKATLSAYQHQRFMESSKGNMHNPANENVARLGQATFRVMRQLIDAQDDAVQTDPANASRILL